MPGAEASLMIDDLGAPVPLTEPAHRVVSLVPSLTEALACTLPERLVGATDWCTHPAGLDVARVRGTKNPDLAAITALRPDLVICNQEENRELDVRRLRAAGVPVWVTRIETLDEAFGSLSRLFQVALGCPGEPDWLGQARICWAKPAAAGRRTVVVPIWRDPWMVVGSRTFTGDLLARLGLDNAFGSASDSASGSASDKGDQRYPRLQLEELLAVEPDLIVLPDEPYAFSPEDGPESFPDKQIALVSGRLLTWYGPSLVEARDELESALGL